MTAAEGTSQFQYVSKVKKLVKDVKEFKQFGGSFSL